MKIALIIICVIFAPFIFYLGAALLGSIDMRLERVIGILYKFSESERSDDEHTVKTRYSKRRAVARLALFGATVLLFTVLTVVAFFTEDIVIGFMMLALGSLLTLLPLCLVLQLLRSYELIKDDGICVHRVFGKRFVSYSDMACYKKDKSAYTDSYDLFIYGINGRRLAWIHGGKVGTRSVLNALGTHEIKEKIDG